jgi:hypothetical protein
MHCRVSILIERPAVATTVSMHVAVATAFAKGVSRSDTHTKANGGMTVRRDE